MKHRHRTIDAPADEPGQGGSSESSEASEVTAGEIETTPEIINLCDAPADVCKKIQGLFPENAVEIVMVGKTQAGINVIGPDGKKEWQKVSIS